MKIKFYNSKKENYYSEWRQDVFKLIKSYGTFNKSLEVGCAQGRLSSELKKDNVINYSVCVEPYAKIESNAAIDEIYYLGIEEALEKKLIRVNSFDLIVLADVLEHTVDPWSVLKNLSKYHLKDEGLIVLSLPNIRNFMSLKKIIFDSSFEYEEEGVFDQTHLRFFCISDMKKMCEKSGLIVDAIMPAYELKDYVYFSKNRLRIVNKFTFGMFRWLLSDQILLACRKFENSKDTSRKLL